MGEANEQPQTPEGASQTTAPAPQGGPAPVPGPTRLGILSLGVAAGITYGLSVFAFGIMTGLFGWGEFVVEVLSSLYVGYEPSIIGSISGGVWGFVHGFFTGAFFAWLYNRLLRSRR